MPKILETQYNKLTYRRYIAPQLVTFNHTIDRKLKNNEEYDCQTQTRIINLKRIKTYVRYLQILVKVRINIDLSYYDPYNMFNINIPFSVRYIDLPWIHRINKYENALITLLSYNVSPALTTHPTRPQTLNLKTLIKTIGKDVFLYAVCEQFLWFHDIIALQHTSNYCYHLFIPHPFKKYIFNNNTSNETSNWILFHREIHFLKNQEKTNSTWKLSDYFIVI